MNDLGTIGGENVTLPNLLKPTQENAIVMYRQMILGLPNQKEGL